MDSERSALENYRTELIRIDRSLPDGRGADLSPIPGTLELVLPRRLLPVYRFSDPILFLSAIFSPCTAFRGLSKE
jgi:hypothetical protein